MNVYCFEDLRVGMQAEFDAEITDEMMRAFAEISGDQNPLHTNAQYAKACGYPERVCYGFLVSALYSRLAGMYLPGENSLLQSAEVFFLSPVYPGDCLHVKGTIVETHELFKHITVKAHILSQNGLKVGRAKLQVGVRNSEFAKEI